MTGRLARPERNMSYAVGGVDLILKSILRDVEVGSYLDVGANHPIDFSNTYVFYEKGWSGYAVDGNSAYRNEWSEIRPRDRFLNEIVSDCRKSVSFEIFPDPTMSTIAQATGERYRLKFDDLKPNIIELEATTIFDIFQSYVNNEVHLLNIDIEGEELNALRGAKLDIFRPGVICVEIKNSSIYDIQENEIFKYVDGFGYRLIAKTPLDTIFVDTRKTYLSWIPDGIV
jgi:FkbM family methyltransferase